MISGLKRLFGLTAYQPLNTIEISKDNLLQNFRYLSLLNKKVKIAPVLKSNAYGHGLVLVAKILDEGCVDWRVPFFCVDSIYEAYELLKANIKTPILIMGYVDPNNLKHKRLPFHYAILNLDFLKATAKYQPGCGVHLFIDTGMHREGIPVNQLPFYLNQIKSLSGIKLEGAMSHLSTAENHQAISNTEQIKNFDKAKKILENSEFKPKWFHILASKSFLHQQNFNKAITLTNMVRVGMALFGIDPSGQNNNLKPVLKLTTKIVQIKEISKGELVGYSGTYRAKQDMVIGILPIGYYDGVDRRLSNNGWVTVNKVACKIVGLVSMNITTIDLTNIPNPEVGQEITIYSNNPSDKNSISNAAKICKTIPYELLIHLASSTKRTAV